MTKSIEKVDINELIAISSEGLQTGEIEPDVAGQICGKPPRLLEIIRKSFKEGKISERMVNKIFALFLQKEEELKMTREAWEFLYHFSNITGNHELYKEAYINFIGNPDNIQNCRECPENKDIKEGSARICGPCGQQNCWVRAHCGML